MAYSNNTTLSLVPLFMLLLLVAQQANCSYVHHEYMGCLHLQNSYVYTQENASFLSIFQSSVQNLLPVKEFPLKPYLILTPSHESEIQAALLCAKKHRIQTRIRSGGHDYEGLSYTSRTFPFVLIDLRNFNSISIKTQDNTAWVESGAILGELYHKIAQTSKTLAFIAGVSHTVGVGGHLSGGGFGMMSRKFGLSIDNIIDAKIMDVNGRILDRKSMGADLFWAIRGGGGTSFGIVLSWKVKLVSVPETVTIFDVTRTLQENATQLLHKWQYIADKIDENLLIRVFIIPGLYSPENGRRSIHVTFTSLFLGGVEELLRIMKLSFPELGLSKEDCKEMRWIESVLFFAGYSTDESMDALLERTPSGVQYLKGKSDFVTEPISENDLKAILERLSGDDRFSCDLQLSPYGGKMSEISESATPFPHRAGNIFMIEYGMGWGDQAETAGSLNWIREFHRFMAPSVSKSPQDVHMLTTGILIWGPIMKKAAIPATKLQVFGEKDISTKTLIDWCT